MDVADIDSAEGWHGLRHLLGGAMPAGPQVRTGGGGWHFWFRPRGTATACGCCPASTGVARVATWWRRRRGTRAGPRTGGSVGPGDHLPAGPAALLELIAGPGDRPRPTGRSRIRTAMRRSRWRRRPTGWRARRSAPATTPSTGRRSRWAGWSAPGCWTPGRSPRELEAAARFAGLGRAETRRTIRSGMTAGRRQPVDDGPLVAWRDAPVDRPGWDGVTDEIALPSRTTVEVPDRRRAR